MGYLSLGIVFGWMMSAIGCHGIWSALMSMLVYAGSSQIMAVELLDTRAVLADVAFLTFVLNFRHLVYGLSMLDKFRGMGWRRFYMIFSLTDETYALLAGVEPPADVDEKQFYFALSLMDHLYWISGSIIGAVAGSLITINTQGIDFAMTALFIVIAVDQWRSYPSHIPAILGAGGTLLSLLLVGADDLLIPALCIIVAGLLLLRPRLEKKGGETQ